MKTAEQKAAREARLEYGRQRAQEFRDSQLTDTEAAEAK